MTNHPLFSSENRGWAMVADERNGYLVGVDVLCDGGSASGKKFSR